MWNRRTSKPTRRSERGLTLVELLVVIVVVGIVAGISIASFTDVHERARQRATMADMRLISRAIAAYSVDNSTIPDPRGGLEALQAVMVPYATNVLPVTDHWGNPYRYARDRSGNYSVESFGRDGLDGTDCTAAAPHDYNHDLVLYNGVFVAAPE